MPCSLCGSGPCSASDAIMGGGGGAGGEVDKYLVLAPLGDQSQHLTRASGEGALVPCSLVWAWLCRSLVQVIFPPVVGMRM